MTERSLSAIYQKSLRRDVAGADADDVLGLSGPGAADPEVLARLARTPEAVAIYGIARSLPAWSNATSAELRRVGTSSAQGNGPARKLGWISIAAAAGFAVFMVGMRPRDAMEAPRPAAAQSSVVSAQATDADIVFVDPDNAMLAAMPSNSGDSIFSDNLDG